MLMQRQKRPKTAPRSGAHSTAGRIPLPPFRLPGAKKHSDKTAAKAELIAAPPKEPAGTAAATPVPDAGTGLAAATPPAKTGSASEGVPHPPATPPSGVGLRGKAAPLAGSPSGSRDTFRRSPQTARAADVDAWQLYCRVRNLLRAPETRANWHWLHDFGYVGPDDQQIVYWGASGFPATMAMLCWDEDSMMYYIGTYTPDLAIRRYYINPCGGNPVFPWLKMAVRYYMVRTARTRGHPNELRRPTSIPDEYFEEHMLDPPTPE